MNQPETRAKRGTEITAFTMVEAILQSANNSNVVFARDQKCACRHVTDHVTASTIPRVPAELSVDGVQQLIFAVLLLALILIPLDVLVVHDLKHQVLGVRQLPRAIRLKPRVQCTMAVGALV